MKSALQSKTLWVAVLQGIVGVIVVLETSVPELGWVAIVKSVVDVILRFLTTSPVGLSNAPTKTT